jgi:hypothetical protein
MKPRLMLVFGVAICVCACAKGTHTEQTSRAPGWTLWPKKEDSLVSALKKKQDASLVRLAQQRAIEEAAAAEAAEAERGSRSRSVPPSMYRTTEPPLPEPDLSLPVSDVPRAAPSPSPSPER